MKFSISRPLHPSTPSTPQALNLSTFQPLTQTKNYMIYLFVEKLYFFSKKIY